MSDLEPNDYGTVYLRMTIDVCVFAEDSRAALRVAREVVREGENNSLGVGEQLARKFMQSIIDGKIEIDDIRDVEVH